MVYFDMMVLCSAYLVNTRSISRESLDGSSEAQRYLHKRPHSVRIGNRGPVIFHKHMGDTSFDMHCTTAHVLYRQVRDSETMLNLWYSRSESVFVAHLREAGQTCYCLSNGKLSMSAFVNGRPDISFLRNFSAWETRIDRWKLLNSVLTGEGDCVLWSFAILNHRKIFLWDAETYNETTSCSSLSAQPTRTLFYLTWTNNPTLLLSPKPHSRQKQARK